MANAVETEGNQPVPLTIRNRPDEFKIEQGLHADQLPFLVQVCAHVLHMLISSSSY
jgi:hypothetical protein